MLFEMDYFDGQSKDDPHSRMYCEATDAAEAIRLCTHNADWPVEVHRPTCAIATDPGYDGRYLSAQEVNEAGLTAEAIERNEIKDGRILMGDYF